MDAMHCGSGKECRTALIWTIDRAEVIENICYLHDRKLAFEPEHCDMQGW